MTGGDHLDPPCRAQPRRADQRRAFGSGDHRVRHRAGSYVSMAAAGICSDMSSVDDGFGRDKGDATAPRSPWKLGRLVRPERAANQTSASERRGNTRVTQRGLANAGRPLEVDKGDAEGGGRRERARQNDDDIRQHVGIDDDIGAQGRHASEEHAGRGRGISEADG